MAEVFGDAGRQWIADLPHLVDEYAQRWALTVHPPFDPLSYNFVAPATGPDGQALVLKAGVPRTELWGEMEALRLYAGRGSALLLDADPARGVMLLEHVQPGTTLASESDDARATEIAAQVMQTLWRPLPQEHGFLPVTEWTRAFGWLRGRFDGGTGPLPADRVALAEALFDELHRSAGPPVLLHGDLHHGNILTGQRAPWLAIDPFGVAGEPANEPGALLHNPTPAVATWPDLRRIQARRVDQLAEILQLDRQRIIGYGIGHAILSAIWTVQDHGATDHVVLACADALIPLLAF